MHSTPSSTKVTISKPTAMRSSPGKSSNSSNQTHSKQAPPPKSFMSRWSPAKTAKRVAPTSSSE